jgi:virginiamycin B lyase
VSRGRGLVIGALTAMIFAGWSAGSADAFVYWANSSTVSSSAVGRANLDGSSADQSFISAPNYTDGVAVDGRFVYWTDDGTNPNGDGEIGRANLDGTDVDHDFIGTDRTPEGIAVDGQYIYWINYYDGSIGRANLDGTNVSQSFITGLNDPEGVAVDANHIYWTESSAIGRANLNGTNVNHDFITAGSTAGGVAVNGQSVFWTNVFTGTIGRANLDGTNVNQNLVTGASEPEGIAVDAQYVYWTNVFGSPQTIGRAELNGGNPVESFIGGVGEPYGVAVDALWQPPTASITAPVNGTTYAVGQVVDSSFTCADGAGAPGLASCHDQNGKGSGAPIDTSTAGLHTLTVTATSQDGQTATASNAYTVVAPPIAPPPVVTPPPAIAPPPAVTLPPAVTAPPALTLSGVPLLSQLRASRVRWHLGSALAHVSSQRKRQPPVGTTVSFTLNEAATVTLAFVQKRSGKPSRKAGSLSLAAPAGADQIVFQGRLSPHRTLRPGSYMVAVTATNRLGKSSKGRTLRCTILP